MTDKKLQPIQIMTLTTASILSVNFLLIQSVVTPIAGQDAWLCIPLGGVVALVLGLLLYYLARLYPGKDLPEIHLAIAGPFWGRVLTLPVTLYVLLHAGIKLRIFADVLKSFLLDQTPTWVIILLMAVVCISVAKRGIYSISSVVDLVYPVAIITFTILILLTYRLWSWSNVQPVLFENTANVFKGTLPVYRFLIGTGGIAYVLRYSIDPKKSLKWFVLGLSIPVLLLTLLTLATLLTFGPEETSTLLYPTLSLSKAIEFPATLLERLETLVAVIWIALIFLVFIAYLFASVRNFAVLFNLKPRYEPYIAYAHAPILIIIALLIKTNLDALTYYMMVGALGVSMKILLVPVVVGMAYIQRKRRKAE